MKGEGNIKVFCRFRPFNGKELAANPTRIHRIQNNSQLIIKDSKQEDTSFLYDFVFDMDSTQDEVFEKVGQPVLNNILDGFHGTIMAYGQTSSGKTHTMQGYDLNEKDNRGLMPRIIEQLFAAIEKSPENVEFKLKIAIFQLYMEKVRDLLDVSKSDLKIREGKNGGFIENLTEVYVSDKHELFRIIAYGQKNRVTCATNMNEHSSRSHLIALLTLNQTATLDGTSKTSKLFLIDLAGSEKISKTGAEGKVLQQAKKINLSLTNLGKVIKALSEQKEKGGHIPYRDSKLTRILKDSLGGNSKTTLIVTCSPHDMHLSESISTLRFGENAQKVKNKPKINRQLTVGELQKIVEKLEIDIGQKSQRIKRLQQYITGTLKADLPVLFQTKSNQKAMQTHQKVEEKQSQKQEEQTISLYPEVQSSQAINEQAEHRIRLLQEQLSCYQFKMKAEMDKYYQLKKEYHDLHDHLTSILKENIEMKDQIDDKHRKSLLSDKSLQGNANLLKLVLAEILTAVPEDQRQHVLEAVQPSYWYQRVIVEGTNCLDYWQTERDKINKQKQQMLNQSISCYSQTEEIKRRQEGRVQKDNQKIIELQQKLGQLFEEYNQMMSQQTHWKAQCQLYQRNLRKKEEDILRLEKQVEELSVQMQEMYLYEDSSHFDDAVSVRSNRIIKPLKGGFIIR